MDAVDEGSLEEEDEVNDNLEDKELYVTNCIQECVIYQAANRYNVEGQDIASSLSMDIT